LNGIYVTLQSWVVDDDVMALLRRVSWARASEPERQLLVGEHVEPRLCRPPLASFLLSWLPIASTEKYITPIPLERLFGW